MRFICFENSDNYYIIKQEILRGIVAMKAHVDLHKWHRLRKKLIVSIICVLGCLSVMAVGVYASTTSQFKISVANDVDIKIANVDGTISVRRNGGIYSDYRKLPGGTSDPRYSDWKSDEETYYNGLALRSADTGVFNKARGNYVEIYNYQMTATTENPKYNRLVNEHLDINYKYPKIEYVFKYEMNVREGVDFPTKITLSYDDFANIGTKTVDDTTTEYQLKVSYQYFIPSYTLAEDGVTEVWAGEPEDWDSEENVNVFPKYDSGNSSTIVTVTSSNPIIYIRCYIEYNTEYFGSSANEGVTLFDSFWNFTLSFYGDQVS